MSIFPDDSMFFFVLSVNVVNNSFHFVAPVPILVIYLRTQPGLSCSSRELRAPNTPNILDLMKTNVFRAEVQSLLFCSFYLLFFY